MGHGWEKVMPKLNELPNKGDTVIGNDVWIGYETYILPGVHICNGAMMAAKSVVTKDVAPYAIVGGNPARVIRTRFDEQSIQKLLEIQWWNWEIEKITQNLSIISSGNVNDLIEATK